MVPGLKFNNILGANTLECRIKGMSMKILKRSIGFCLLLASFTVLLSHGVSSSDDINEYKVTITEHGHVLVDVFIGEEGPFPFVFDTGAGTMVDEELAATLQLKQKGTTKIYDFAGIKGKVPVFELGTLQTAGLRFKVKKALGLNTKILRFGCSGARGIIGGELIKQKNWQINFQDSTLKVSSNPFVLQKNSMVIPIKKYTKRGGPLLDYSYGSTITPFPILFDTGNPGLMTIPTYIYDLMDKDHYTDLNSHTIDSKDFGGLLGSKKQQIDYLAFSTIRLGNTTVENFLAQYSENTMYTLGTHFFSKGLLTLNNSSQVLGYDFSEAKKELKPHLMRAGFRLGINDTSIYVGALEKGGPAAQVGIQLGDICKEVNGISASDLLKNKCEALSTLLAWMKNGTEIRVVIERLESPVVLPLMDRPFPVSTVLN